MRKKVKKQNQNNLVDLPKNLPRPRLVGAGFPGLSSRGLWHQQLAEAAWGVGAGWSPGKELARRADLQ